jgi:hypothetical protein
MKPRSWWALGLVVTAGAASLGALGGCDEDDEESIGEAEVPLCDAGDASFVREATLALLGRRPFSAREVEIGTEKIAELESAHPGEGRRRWALALMDSSAFIDRWSRLLQDNLNVPRVGIQAMSACYAKPMLKDDDDRARLAEFVRDNAAIDDTYDESFNFGDLLRGAILIDDVMPAYRAHLYALLTNLNGCGNVDEVGQELAYREEVGHVFETAYLNRDPVCLTCHNTKFSVTNSGDPATDRHWPVDADVETAVFGQSTVKDPNVPRGVFRVSGFVGGGSAPFPDFDGTIAYCFDEASMNLYKSVCAAGTASCADASPSFCLSPFDMPTCGDDGTAGACADTPFCVDEQFTSIDVVDCSSGTPSCADANPYPICGNGVVAPYCDVDGTPKCPPLSDGGGMGGGQEGPPEGSFQPWGADDACGVFAKEIADDDVADIDAHFASVKGKRASVALLEQSLRRGADSLHRLGLVKDARGAVENPDEGFAWLVSMNIVDNVFREVIGTPLTISTRFPRNAAQKKLLQTLTTDFAKNQYSLKELLADIVTSRYFNIKSPDAGCTDAYAWPAVFDPWVLAEQDPAKRKNAASDALHPLSARTLLSAAYTALGWPEPAGSNFPTGLVEDLDPACFDMFPDCPSLETACERGTCCAEKDALCGNQSEALSEEEIQRGIGVFLGISEKGFRGLDFQARLFFEARFGRCEKPSGVNEDAVDKLVASLAKDATLRDAIGALKDRFVSDATIDESEEKALKSIFATDLGASASSVADLSAGLRTVCGALLASPQFQLTGMGLRVAAPDRLPSRKSACAEAPVPGCE